MKEQILGRRSVLYSVLALLMALIFIFSLIGPTISKYITEFPVGEFDVAIAKRRYKVTLVTGETGSLPQNFENPFYVTWGDPYPTLPYPSDPYDDIAFGGWYASPDYDDHTRVMTGYDFGEPGDKVLYALWVSEHYTVYFDANGGEGEMEPLEKTFADLDQFERLPWNEFTKEGYVFKNWSTNPDGTGRIFMDNEVAGQIIKDQSGEVTLYAQWAQGDAVINFEGALEDPTQRARIVNYGQEYGTMPVVPEHSYSAGEEYDFQGWRTEDAAMVLAEDIVPSSIGLKQTLYANYSNVVETDNVDRFISIAGKDNNGDLHEDNFVMSFGNGYGYERVNIPFHNLIPGITYRLTFKVDNGEASAVSDPDAVYGCFMSEDMLLSTDEVISKASTPGVTGEKILARSGDTIANGYVDDQANAFAFEATSDVMYWVWDFGLWADRGVERIQIYDISLDGLVEVPNIRFNDAELRKVTDQTLTIEPEFSIREAVDNRYMHYTFKAGTHHEQIIIPVDNLIVGQKYKIDFSEIYPGSYYADDGYQYSCAMFSSNEMNIWWTWPDNSYSGDRWFAVKDVAQPMQHGSITFTATASEMYWTWFLGACDYHSLLGAQDMFLNATKVSHILHTGERILNQSGNMEFELGPQNTRLRPAFITTNIDSGDSNRADPIRYFTGFRGSYPIKVYINGNYTMPDKARNWFNGIEYTIPKSSMVTGTDDWGSYYQYDITYDVIPYDETCGKISTKVEPIEPVFLRAVVTNAAITAPFILENGDYTEGRPYASKYTISLRASNGYQMSGSVTMTHMDVAYTYDIANMDITGTTSWGGNYYTYTISNDYSGDVYIPYGPGGTIIFEFTGQPVPAVMMMKRPDHYHCDCTECTVETCGHAYGDIMPDEDCAHEHTWQYECDCVEEEEHIHCDNFDCTVEACGHTLGDVLPSGCDCGHEHTDMYDCDCPPVEEEVHRHCDNEECNAETCGHAYGDFLPSDCDCGHEHTDTYPCDCLEEDEVLFHSHCNNEECTIETCGHALGDMIYADCDCGHEHTGEFPCGCLDESTEEVLYHSHCDNPECVAEYCGHAMGDMIYADCDCGHEHTGEFPCGCLDESTEEEVTHIHCDCIECTAETCGHAYGDVLPEECDCGHEHSDGYVCDCPEDDTTEGDSTEGDNTTTEDGTQDPALPPEEDNDDPALPPEDGGDGGNGGNTGGSEEDSEEGEGTGDSGGSTDEGGDTTEGETTTPEGGNTTEGENTTPEGGDATEGENTTPEGGEATEGETTTPEGGESTEGENTTPEGSDATEGENTTPEGGDATEGENTTSEGENATEGENTTPEGGNTTESENTTSEGGDAETGEAAIPEGNDAAVSGSTGETGGSTDANGSAEGDGSASAESTASDAGGESTAGESAGSSEPSGETI